jgi:hypothetical protein
VRLFPLSSIPSQTNNMIFSNAVLLIFLKLGLPSSIAHATGLNLQCASASFQG